MDRKLRKVLAECIRDIETGASDVEGCLRLHPDRAAELRPHLELWSSLGAASRAEPSLGSLQRGQQRLLTALADMENRGEKTVIPSLVPAVAKVAAVVAGVMLLAGGAMGASAALGGPNVADEVLSGIGISNASDTGKQHANQNAIDGADNAGQGMDNASDTGKQHANQNAIDGADSAGQGMDNASDTGKQHANQNAIDGADNADGPDGDVDGAGDADDDLDDGDAPDDVTPDDVPPDSVPAPDSLPDDAQVPDSLPVGPQR